MYVAQESEGAFKGNEGIFSYEEPTASALLWRHREPPHVSPPSAIYPGVAYPEAISSPAIGTTTFDFKIEPNRRLSGGATRSMPLLDVYSEERRGHRSEMSLFVQHLRSPIGLTTPLPPNHRH